MIDARVAAAEIERLSGLNWFPREEAALHELVLAAQAAYSEIILAFVVNEWLAYQTDAPKPAQLRALIWIENNKLEAIREDERQAKISQRGAHCPECHDFGIVESVAGAPIESACRYCDCRSGQQRKARAQFDECNPEAINAARQKLLKLSGTKAALHAILRRTNPTKIFADDYNGEF